MAKAPAPPRPNPPPPHRKNICATVATAIHVQGIGSFKNDAGAKNGARIPGCTHNRSWANCGRRTSALVRERSPEARRDQNCIATNCLCKFHDESKCLHRVERDTYWSILCGFHTTQHALVCFSGAIYDWRSISFSRSLLFAQNGCTWRYSKLHSGYRIQNRTGSNSSSSKQVSERHRPKFWYYYRVKAVYGYGFSTSSHIHTICRNFSCKASLTFHLGSLTCPGGLGGGTGLAGNGALATKVSLLESVGKARMRKKGELGNQFSHMGGVA